MNFDDDSQMMNVSDVDMPALQWRQFNEAINAPATYGQPEDRPGQSKARRG